MKKLVIILTIAFMLFATPKQPTEQSSTAPEGTPLNAAMEQAEKVPKTNTEQVERITEPICEPVPTEATEKETAVQSPMKEYDKETGTQKVKEPEETVKCVDEGNQNLTEYKPQPNGQPNHFENAKPAEIVDHPVEVLIGKGEDRPREGKHF